MATKVLIDADQLGLLLGLAVGVQQVVGQVEQRGGFDVEDGAMRAEIDAAIAAAEATLRACGWRGLN